MRKEEIRERLKFLVEKNSLKDWISSVWDDVVNERTFLEIITPDYAVNPYAHEFHIVNNFTGDEVFKFGFKTQGRRIKRIVMERRLIELAKLMQEGNELVEKIWDILQNSGATKIIADAIIDENGNWYLAYGYSRDIGEIPDKISVGDLVGVQKFYYGIEKGKFEPEEISFMATGFASYGLRDYKVYHFDSLLELEDFERKRLDRVKIENPGLIDVVEGLIEEAYGEL